MIRSKLDLPQEAGEREAAQMERALVIDIQPDGSLSVGGQPADRERLVSVITTEAAEAGGVAGLKVVVRADRNAPSRHLNAVAADLAALGVRGWRIATAPPAGGGGGGIR
ncbi:MAG TPA: biopolymer transporter ExbD [Solirubrobacterales bacterium]|nr:biopolymer transporter ExbD [Solirubrobacterales bacterium]